ncbi:hypothetical protein FRC06_006201, partial [Ceratobasidium sp. 370]
MQGFGGAEESTRVRIGIQSINIHFTDSIGPVTVTVRDKGYQLEAEDYGARLRWDWDLGPIELGWFDSLTISVEGKNGHHFMDFHFGVGDLVRATRSGVPASPRDPLGDVGFPVEVSLVLDSVTIVSSAKGSSQKTPDASHPRPQVPETGTYRIWNVGFRCRLAACEHKEPLIQLDTDIELDTNIWWIEKIEGAHKHTIFNDKSGEFLTSLGYQGGFRSVLCLSWPPDLWTIQSVDSNGHFLIKNAHTGYYLGVYQAYRELELRPHDDITDEVIHWMLEPKE